MGGVLRIYFAPQYFKDLMQDDFIRASNSCPCPAAAAGLFAVVDGISCQVMTLAVQSAGGLSTTTYSHIQMMV